MKSEKEHKNIIAAITHGDVNGIGYEVILKTLSDKRVNDFCIPDIYGNSKAASYHRKTLTLSDFVLTMTSDVKKLHAGKSYICNINNKEISITTSIGISIYPKDGEGIDELMMNADKALYEAKSRGRNRYEFFKQS